MNLRDYQLTAKQHVLAAWAAGAQNVGLQLPTGAGKTVIISNIAAEERELTILIAHRVELVSQISLTLGRHGVRHNIIAQRGAIRTIVTLHMTELKRSYYHSNSNCIVAGVDTLIRMNEPWFSRVKLVIQDEGHHPLKTNKWGKAAELFPNARGLYPTATPVRADGCGLGRHADGLLDTLVIGPSMRELINRGYLTDYRIFAPPSDLDLSTVTISASGDYSPPKLRNAVHKSHITGDVVSHYLRIAPNKLGVTFAVDIEAAKAIATEFRLYGVAAEVISSKTPDLLRSQIMQRFRNREILQLVNVDLLGEGVDVPAIEVVSMARPTQSYALYSQQFGRALRLMEGKTYAIIIDHVGNVLRHGLPDAPRSWSLDRRERRARGTALGVTPVRTCGNPLCFSVYERTKRVCPFCGFYTPPIARTAPEQVDGDLLELDAEVLARLRGEISRVDAPARTLVHLDEIAQRAVFKRHYERQQAQAALREKISLWAGYQRHRGKDDSEIYRLFYFENEVDIASAQALGTRAAEELTGKLEQQLQKLNIIGENHG